MISQTFNKLENTEWSKTYLDDMHLHETPLGTQMLPSPITPHKHSSMRDHSKVTPLRKRSRHDQNEIHAITRTPPIISDGATNTDIDNYKVQLYQENADTSNYPSTNTERLMQVLACDIDSVGTDIEKAILLKQIFDSVYEYKLTHLRSKEK